MNRALAAIVLLGGFAATARANSIITWSTPQTITGASDVSTLGTLVSSATADPNGGTVNGVPFSYSSSFCYNSTSSGLPSAGTPDATYNDLLSYFQYRNTYNNNLAYTDDSDLAGLTVGNTYEVEYWVNDTRDLFGSGITRSEYFSGGDDTYGGGDTSAAVLYPGDGSGPGQYIIGTFTADSTVEVVGITPVASTDGDAGGEINMLEIRDITAVPEPTTLALAGLGGAALLFRKRRNA
jgi:hypothetical protein